MRRPDIYDQMFAAGIEPERDVHRIAELEAAVAEREAVMADVIALAELCRRIVQPPVKYVL